MVSLKAKGADPYESIEINTAEGVQHSGARFASEGSVGKDLKIHVWADRLNRGGDRDHTLRRLHLRSRPIEPRHPDSFNSLRVGLS